MTGIRVWKGLALIAGCSLAVSGFRGGVRAEEERTVGVSDCYFAQDPDQFLNRQGRIRTELFERSARLNRALTSGKARAAVAAASLPVRNFIDQEIFGKLSQLNIPAAPLSSDAEFLRRVTLDLTGRIPTPQDVKAFLNDTSENKRDATIERLLYSPEATDRWTMWMGDWLQNTATLASAAIQRQISGRNAFHAWIQDAVYSQKSLKDVVYECIVATGNNYDGATGAANFPIGADTAMGPIQDRYDTALAKSASMFLGLSYYDCILCHNGRGHLDQLSLWGSRAPRIEALQMAAFFSRMRFTAYPRTGENPFYVNSQTVTDASTGAYDLNTSNGNRPARLPIGNIRNLTPTYRLGGTPSDGNWRAAFAENLINDPMFARNLANRLWKAVFNLGLVEPVDGMDPARLDPANPPAEPWTLQATHPELLEKLAAELVNLNYQLRPFLRFLVQSSAYQLSSRYDGDWNVQYVPLFARHYARRLEGEEIHDAIAQATGMTGAYTVTGFGDPIRWAMQFPEPVEPRNNNGNVNSFLNPFVRGNRDTQQRTQAGSIQQQLALMNDAFVNNRVRVANSAVLRSIGQLTNQEAVLNEVYLLFLGRYPSASERGSALAFLQRKWATAALRNEAVEDLAWVCINKSEFLFSY